MKQRGGRENTLDTHKILDEVKMIFDKLLASNISVLTLERSKLLSDVSVYMVNKKNHTGEEIEIMKYLVMICNLLYNRTDMLVLPVEDGVYDLLLEQYKVYDKNFQVGSAVVEFKSLAEEANPEIKNIVQPIYIIDKVDRDPIRELVYNTLSSFDKNKFNYKDLIPADITPGDTYINKREHNTKHNHPDLVGTLDKCKFVTDKEAIELGVYNDPNVKILERDFFGKHIQMGIIKPDQELEMVLELKYDGISVEADCSTYVESARSRGDTGIGEASDMTPILFGYPFKHNNVVNNPIGVKFEAIMTKSDLYNFNKVRGKNYANCRTAIIGLFGASDASKFRDYITLVPLAVDRDQVPEITNRIEEIEFCNRLFRSNGEPLRYMYIHGNYQECLYQIKKFVEEAFSFRENVDFMFDGVVVSYIDENIRKALGRQNYINKYSMAIKFNPLSKLTTFLGYTYEVGQNGTICPMLHYSPVEFFGTIHTKSSGSSLNRFRELNLKVGDIIKVTYTNDVMPYVTSVDCDQNRKNTNPLCEFPNVCPICGTPLQLSDSGKTAFCSNLKCNGRVIGRMTNMLAKLNIKGFAESTIKTLGISNFATLMEVKYDNIADLIGPTNASNFIMALDHIRNSGIDDYILIGSLGFTGIAAQKWKLVFENYTLSELYTIYREGNILNALGNIKGLGPITAQTIENEFNIFLPDIEYILTKVNFVNSKNKSKGKLQIRFTGCRNLQLQEQLINSGYDCDGNGSVTKKTDILLVPYLGFNSTKLSKVGPNCKIIPIQEFIDNMQKYL